MTLTEPAILTEEELRQLCKEWQEILRLQDWDVTVEIKRSRDFKGQCRTAEVTWVLTRKTAHVKILDPADYNESHIVKADMELDLVHELVHLPLVYCDRTEKDSLEEEMLEQAVHTYSSALVSLKRRNHEKEKNLHDHSEFFNTGVCHRESE